MRSLRCKAKKDENSVQETLRHSDFVIRVNILILEDG